MACKHYLTTKNHLLKSKDVQRAKNMLCVCWGEGSKNKAELISVLAVIFF